MKRKHTDSAPPNGKSKKRALSDDEAKNQFRKGLFDSKLLQDYTKSYANSEPYKHAVIQNLITEPLLRDVRKEIQEHLSFTPKETDIYKIFQSGDLANLDGLDDSSLRRLPSLLNLRDALYSSAFRKYVSTIANAGPLSGRKTDMAINVYTPGCHLLCHDDVIGSRRVSYILYLTDPDRPWKSEWGGALRLYPTANFQDEDGTEMKVPQPDFSKSIPPAFNQLSFFAVQPGESFHDVEEVYKRAERQDEDDGGRVRMAISGWYHIPQEGEEGYEEGLEERLAEKSSLQQLQGKMDKYDKPKKHWHEYTEEEKRDEEEPELTEEDLQFLLKFMTPTYLTPDTVEELSTMFEEESSLRLSNFLSKKFSEELRSHVVAAESATGTDDFDVARPPHKHRFLYQQPTSSKQNTKRDKNSDPYKDLLDTFFPSLAFKKWLSLATGLSLSRANILARRFRRGMDYTLATSYDEPEPQLEVCLGITPSPGWGGDDDDAEDGEDADAGAEKQKENGSASSKTAKNGSAKAQGDESDTNIKATEDDSVGGYEVYMAGDDDESDAGSDHGVSIPAGAAKGKAGASASGSTSTGAGNRRGKKADPAIYRSSAGDDEDDGVLFSMPAGWNTMSVVLRDTGVLRFVKYVSKSARGDRWDVCGEWEVVPEKDEGEEDGEDGEEWNGFDD